MEGKGETPPLSPAVPTQHRTVVVVLPLQLLVVVQGRWLRLLGDVCREGTCGAGTQGVALGCRKVALGNMEVASRCQKVTLGLREVTPRCREVAPGLREAALGHREVTLRCRGRHLGIERWPQDARR